ncbi:MAG: glycosyltransferase family 39 protein [Bdellovibrionota bacterium]|nr:MAG: glycosyltransferase family 39 protein [Bdellovibrionota bacterium]
MVAENIQRAPIDRSVVQFYLWAIGVLLLAMVWLGSAEFYTRGEPREAIVAQAMLETGNFVSPRVYGDRVPSKPPLFHWLAAAASVFTSGLNEFSVRLPSLLAAFVATLAIFIVVKREYGHARALATVFMLVTSIEWFRSAVVARVDMLLACCLTLAFLAGFRWQQDRYRGIGWPVIIFSALATLTKGPVGIALPCVVLALWQLLHREPILSIGKRLLIVAFLAVIPYLIWVVAGVVMNGDALLSKLLYENVARFTGTTEDNPHSHSFVYLWLTLLVGFLPWTVAALAQWMQSTKWLWHPTQWWQRANPLERYAALIVVVVVTFFSIPESKRSVYLLPAYPFISLLLAHSVLSIVDRVPALLIVAARIAGFLSLAFGLFLAATIVARLLPIDGFIQAHALSVHEVIGLEECVILLVGLLLLVARRSYLQRFQPRHAMYALLGGLFLMGYAVGLPVTAAMLSERDFASTLSARVPQGSPIYSVDNEFYALNFYSRRGMATKEVDALAADDFVVLFLDKADALQEPLATRALGYREIERSSRYVRDWGRVLSLGRIERISEDQPESMRPLH